MSYGIHKMNHGIYKFTAIQDYDVVKKFCESNNLPVFEPSGKHWHRIEDATAAMMHQMTLLNLDFKLYLNRGSEYYLSLKVKV